MEIESACQDCAEDLEHCHEILVFHTDGSAYCTDIDCEGLVHTHEWVTTCVDLGWRCICTKTGHTMPLAA